MITMFVRRGTGSVSVLSVHDQEQAAALLEVLRDCGVPCAAAPARIRQTVAQLVLRRDAALDRETAAATVRKRRAALRLAPG